MEKHLIIATIKYNPGMIIFSYSTKEKQEEMFSAVKATGILEHQGQTIPIASAYKADILERYEATTQIDHPISMNLN